MKKQIAALTAVILFGMNAAAMRGELIDIKVTVNGSEVQFEDQQPVIIKERTLLPIRNVMESLGKEVSWDSGEQRATITDTETTLSLVIGSDIMTRAHGSETEEITLDSVPVIINDRTCLPVRAVAEAFGAEVSWDEVSKTVIINER